MHDSVWPCLRFTSAPCLFRTQTCERLSVRFTRLPGSHNTFDPWLCSDHHEHSNPWGPASLCSCSSRSRCCSSRPLCCERKLPHVTRHCVARHRRQRTLTRGWCRRKLTQRLRRSSTRAHWNNKSRTPSSRGRTAGLRHRGHKPRYWQHASRRCSKTSRRHNPCLQVCGGRRSLRGHRSHTRPMSSPPCAHNEKPSRAKTRQCCRRGDTSTVSIDAGGRIFKVALQSLQRHPYLNAFVANHVRSCGDAKPCFLDIGPTTFAVMLMWLRVSPTKRSSLWRDPTNTLITSLPDPQLELLAAFNTKFDGPLVHFKAEQRRRVRVEAERDAAEVEASQRVAAAQVQLEERQADWDARRQNILTRLRGELASTEETSPHTSRNNDRYRRSLQAYLANADAHPTEDLHIDHSIGLYDGMGQDSRELRGAKARVEHAQNKEAELRANHVRMRARDTRERAGMWTRFVAAAAAALTCSSASQFNTWDSCLATHTTAPPATTTYHHGSDVQRLLGAAERRDVALRPCAVQHVLDELAAAVRPAGQPIDMPLLSRRHAAPRSHHHSAHHPQHAAACVPCAPHVDMGSDAWE